MKERRIGTFTLGTMLVVYGILFVVNIFCPNTESN